VFVWHFWWDEYVNSRKCMAFVEKVLGNVLRAGEGEKSIHKAAPEYF